MLEEVKCRMPYRPNDYLSLNIRLTLYNGRGHLKMVLLLIYNNYPKSGPSGSFFMKP